mmetsp:Transcript_46915/g.116942  ORF Transcript_46915/g.116942 Transcript_46915/m.116942 type:complete len:226 (+) Transcript_46915:1194-1871(+)
MQCIDVHAARLSVCGPFLPRSSTKSLCPSVRPSVHLSVCLSLCRFKGTTYQWLMYAPTPHTPCKKNRSQWSSNSPTRTSSALPDRPDAPPFGCVSFLLLAPPTTMRRMPSSDVERPNEGGWAALRGDEGALDCWPSPSEKASTSSIMPPRRGGLSTLALSGERDGASLHLPKSAVPRDRSVSRPSDGSSSTPTGPPRPPTPTLEPTCGSGTGWPLTSSSVVGWSR